MIWSRSSLSSFAGSDYLPLNAIARLESLVLHSQVRGVEVRGCVERFDSQDDVVEEEVDMFAFLIFVVVEMVVVLRMLLVPGLR
jgi:hypothetical protein